MNRSPLLTIDSLINLLLGVLLLVFPRGLISFLGIPEPASASYPNILGAVLFGIGIALWVERGAGRGGGHGLGGAVVINLCGALVLPRGYSSGTFPFPSEAPPFSGAWWRFS